jgi:hypothetical protein
MMAESMARADTASLRSLGELRSAADEEWDEFQEHLLRPCLHEHACIRCAQRSRRGVVSTLFTLTRPGRGMTGRQCRADTGRSVPGARSGESQ